MTTRERINQFGCVVDRAVRQDLDSTDGAWVAICSKHGSIVNTRTMREAMSSAGVDFCDGCRDDEQVAETLKRIATESRYDVISALWEREKHLRRMTLTDRADALRDMRRELSRDSDDE